MQLASLVGYLTIRGRTYSKGWSLDQNILLQMCLENIHDFMHLKERAPMMSAYGIILEHSPRFVPLHQASGKSQNYQTGFVMPSKNPSTTTPTLNEEMN
ncbi:hypothetical protein ACS0TY_008263 [Phlomoides rotata]